MGEYVNSQQVRFDKSHVSCGVLEIHHLPNKQPHEIAFALANHLYHKANPRPAAIVLWSDVISPELSRGQRLAEFFKTDKLGKLIATNHTINPRTGNTICLWVLEVDHDAFRAYYTDMVMHNLHTE